MASILILPTEEINEKAIRKIVVPEAMSPFEDKTEGKVGPEEEKHTAGGVKNVGGAVGELKGEGQTSGQIKSKKEATKTTGPTAPRNFDELRKTSSGTPRSRRTSSVYPAKHKLPFTSGEKTTPLEDSKDVEKGLGAILTSTPSSDTKTTAGGGRKRSGARKGGPMCGGAN